MGLKELEGGKDCERRRERDSEGERKREGGKEIEWEGKRERGSECVRGIVLGRASERFMIQICRR